MFTDISIRGSSSREKLDFSKQVSNLKFSYFEVGSIKIVLYEKEYDYSGELDQSGIPLGDGEMKNPRKGGTVYLKGTWSDGKPHG